MPNKPSKMVLYRLDTMLESISFIEQICKECGGIDLALSDRKTARPAIMMHLSSIQQQFTNIALKNELDSIESISKYHLQGLYGTRNVISHNYERLNIDLMINAIINDLPNLKTEIKNIVKDFQGKTPQEKLSRMIANYVANKGIFYEETKLLKENAILNLYNELKNAGMKIDEQGLKVIESIQQELNANTTQQSKKGHWRINQRTRKSELVED